MKKNIRSDPSQLKFFGSYYLEIENCICELKFKLL